MTTGPVEISQRSNVIMKPTHVYKVLAGLTLIGTLLFSAAYADEPANIKPPESTAATAAGAEKNPENAAIVNGTAIAYDTFATELELNQRRMQQQGHTVPEAMMPQLRSQVLDNLINQELLFQESAKKKIHPSPAEIDKEVTAIKSRFKDPTEFESTLARMRMDEKKLRRQIAQRSAIRSLIDKEIGADITVSDVDAQSFYDSNPSYFQRPEQVHARHILIKVAAGASDKDKAAARKKIADIKKRIDKGEDFGEVAKSVSEGPSSAKGGDLGFFARGQMVKPFEDAAFALKPNEVSDIVETQFGYHLIQLLERRPAETVAFNDVKERIVGNLRNERLQQKIHTYLDELRKQAKIERFVK
jgi:peptidyl-prolyl cis-trans isomerase C